MSIIHDALKKVQDKNAKEAAAKAGPLPAPSSTPAPAGTPTAPVTPGTARDNPVIIFLLGVLIAGIMIWGIITNMPKSPAPQISITASRVPIAAAPAPAPQPAATAPAPSEDPDPLPEPAQPKIDPADPLSSMRIEGIMDMGGGKKVALINGNIYEEGQTIYGRIISKIALDSVTVMEEGRQRILPVTPPKP